MKKLIFILYLFLFAFTNLKAQTTSENVSGDIEYNLEFEFSGETTSALDSTFIVYCVIDASKVKDYEKIIVKSGKNSNLLKEQQIDLSDETKVSKKSGKLKIELGKAGENLSNVEVLMQKKENGDVVKILISKNQKEN